MAKRKFYGIKYPFTVQGSDKTFIDLTTTPQMEVVSEMMHVIFTPQGERLRQPEFGTRLIQYIFNPNDAQTWGDVVGEIKEAVKKFVPMCTIKDVNVTATDNGMGMNVAIRFGVGSDGKTYEVTATI